MLSANDKPAASGEGDGLAGRQAWRATKPALTEVDVVAGLTGHVGLADVLGGLAQAEFGLAADIQHARLAEGLKEPVEEDLGLTLFVAGDVMPDPGGELRKLFLARHGGFVHESAGLCQQAIGAGPGHGFRLGKDE